MCGESGLSPQGDTNTAGSFLVKNCLQWRYEKASGARVRPHAAAIRGRIVRKSLPCHLQAGILSETPIYGNIIFLAHP